MVERAGTAATTSTNGNVAQATPQSQSSSEKNSLREYTITDREMLRNLNPASLSSDEGRSYLKNYQQARKEYVDNKNSMSAEEKRLRDPKLSNAQKDEARKKDYAASAEDGRCQTNSPLGKDPFFLQNPAAGTVFPLTNSP